MASNVSVLPILCIVAFASPCWGEEIHPLKLAHVHGMASEQMRLWE